MKKLLFVVALFAFVITAGAQQFEEPKLDPISFEKVKPFVGADFALQYQSLTQHADGLELMPIGTGINLPAANLNVGADLAPGMRVELVTYLSSRHHNEAWVKGGFLQMDALPFINSEAIDGLMKYLTFKVGVMELNYGDGHFRRSDNARVINNPFVGNYVMDAFQQRGFLIKELASMNNQGRNDISRSFNMETRQELQKQRFQGSADDESSRPTQLTRDSMLDVLRKTTRKGE